MRKKRVKEALSWLSEISVDRKASAKLICVRDEVGESKWVGWRSCVELRH